MNLPSAVVHLDPGAAFGGFVLSMMATLVTAVLLSPLYLALLTVWAALGPRLGRFETSRAWFAAAVMILAIPAACVVAFENRDATPLTSGLFAFAGAWLGLVIPRITSRSLPLGSFAAASAPT